MWSAMKMWMDFFIHLYYWHSLKMEVDASAGKKHYHDILTTTNDRHEMLYNDLDSQWLHNKVIQVLVVKWHGAMQWAWDVKWHVVNVVWRRYSTGSIVFKVLGIFFVCVSKSFILHINLASHVKLSDTGHHYKSCHILVLSLVNNN